MQTVQISNTIRLISQLASSRHKTLSKATWEIELVKKVMWLVLLNKESLTHWLLDTQHRQISNQARQHRWGTLVLLGAKLVPSLAWQSQQAVAQAMALERIISLQMVIKHRTMPTQITAISFKSEALKVRWMQQVVIKRALTTRPYYRIKTIPTMLTTLARGVITLGHDMVERDGSHLERNKVLQARIWRMECSFETIAPINETN